MAAMETEMAAEAVAEIKETTITEVETTIIEEEEKIKEESPRLVRLLPSAVVATECEEA
jgi:hypothetical protein